MISAIKETFSSLPLNPQLRWFNEPSRWQTSDRGLQVWSDAPTDFWQRTHYGFRADNGHVLAAETTGDFVMECDVRFYPQHQYDQAGLMVRFDEDSWIKCSVEFEADEPSRLGCVVTNSGYSDWSTQDVSGDCNRLQFQIRRVGADFHVAHRPDVASHWSQMRIAHLAIAEQNAISLCGIYVCSPKNVGFRAEFQSLVIRAT